MKPIDGSRVWNMLRRGLLALMVAQLLLIGQAASTRAYSGELVYAVTASNALIQFNSANPGVVTSRTPITNLPLGETIVGMDFRPLNGQLVLVGRNSRLYTLDPRSAAATVIGTQAFSTTLSGTSFGVDFNPNVDRIRVVSNTGQNLRINPTTGAIGVVDPGLAYAAGDVNAGATPQVVAAAYTRNFTAAPVSSLYVIDSNLDTLVLQGSKGSAPVSPNAGQLFTVGALGVDVGPTVTFDIAPSGAAFVAYSALIGTSSSFAPIDLTTGRLGPAVRIGGGLGEIISAMTIPTRPAIAAQPVYAVTQGGKLVQFNSLNPALLTSQKTLMGLQAGETVIGLDFRPATGQLLAVGSTSRIYIIDPVSAAANMIGSQPFSPTLSGTSFGMDFNPSVDRIRLVSNSGQNLRLNPLTGGLAATDTPLAYAATDVNAGTPPQVVAGAYTRNISGTTATSLYVIDANLNTLALQGSPGSAPISPNSGQLTTVGALNIDVSDNVSFDINNEGAAFVAYGAPMTTTTSFGALDLTTGRIAPLGNIAGETVIAIALETRQATPPRRLLATTMNNQLLEFSSANVTTPIAQRTITGLQANEYLIGIDIRPANGRLYGISNNSRLYTLNYHSGIATPIGSGPISPTLDSQVVGFDFNPQVDRIRIVTALGQNLRFNPNTGALAGNDTRLAYAASDTNAGMQPNISAAAYTNNISGTLTTSLYVIDTNLNTLALQGGLNSQPSPNGGQLFTVGTLGATNIIGFDIDRTNVGYIAFNISGSPHIATVDLSSGRALTIGTLGNGQMLTGLTIITTDQQRYLPLIFKN